MKRLLIICSIILVVLIGGTTLVALIGRSGTESTSGGGQTLEQPAEPPAEAAPAAWDGRGVRPVQATFFLGGQQIVIDQLAFAALDAPTATVAVKATVIPVGAAKWINNAFVLRSAVTTWRAAKPKITRAGERYAVTAVFKDVPTDQLNGGIALLIRYPGSDVSMAVFAPDLPEGAALGQASATEAGTTPATTGSTTTAPATTDSTTTAPATTDSTTTRP